MKPVVYVPEPIAPGGLALLKSECQCLIPWETGVESDRNLLYDSDAVVVRLFTVDGEDFRKSKRLKVVAKHGVGGLPAAA